MSEMTGEEIRIRLIVAEQTKDLKDRLARVEKDLAKSIETTSWLIKYVKTGLEPEC